MRTTIDLPEELFRRVKARAAMTGVKLKELITRYVEQGLQTGGSVSDQTLRRRSELPVARPAAGRPLRVLSNSELFALLEEEDARRNRPA